MLWIRDIPYWYGSVDSDPYHWLPDTRIRTTDLWIRNRLQIRILFFLAVAFCVLLITFWRYIYISLRYKKGTKKPQNSTVEIKIFLTFIALWRKDLDQDLDPDPSKQWRIREVLRVLQIWIHNTGRKDDDWRPTFRRLDILVGNDDNSSCAQNNWLIIISGAREFGSFDPDPDPTFHLMPILIRIVSQVLLMLEKQTFFTFISSNFSLHYFIFLVSVIARCHNFIFSILDRIF